MSSVYRAFVKKPIELFTIRVKSDNAGTSGTNQFTFTGAAGNYDVISRNESNNNIQTFSNLSGPATITFADGIGTYELKIRPKGNSNATRFRRIQFLSGGDRLKLLEIKKWGNVKWESFNTAFRDCANLELTADDIPDTSLCSDMIGMFQNCSTLTGSSANWAWNTSTITSMTSMFNGASLFNQNIGSWNTSNVTTMASMFYLATSFNQDLSAWNVSKVTTFGLSFTSGMFGGASSFTNAGQPLSWTINTTQPVTMGGMFRSTPFNQDITTWNTSQVTNTQQMFQSNITFNQPIGNWNTGNITTMFQMFTGATLFNQNIGDWNTSNVLNMRNMFNGASDFNNGGVDSIGTWVTSLVTNMQGMFAAAPDFNQDIGGWTVSNVLDMSGMFAAATLFNQDIGGWNVGNVLNMGNMFGGAVSFNNGGSASIVNWNTTSVTDRSSMFSSTNSFNQDIGDWNISSVTNFTNFMAAKTDLQYSAANLDSIYNKWSLLSVQPNINISFGSVKYNASAQTGRDILDNAPNNWTITDGGQV